MAQFLFQPDPIDRVKFKPIKIDIHQGVIKIVDDEIFYDFQLNTTESVIVGTDREEVLERIQRGFKNRYNLYGKLKQEDIKALDYETLQIWKRLQRHITFFKLKILLPHFNIAHIILRNSIRDWYRLIASNFRDRKEALLIRHLPIEVTRRAVATGKKVRFIIIGEPTTYLFRVLPYHRCVVTSNWTHGVIVRPTVIILLFRDPEFCHRSYVCRFMGRTRCNVLTLVMST
jgi:hypothetical protein